MSILNMKIEDLLAFKLYYCIKFLKVFNSLIVIFFIYLSSFFLFFQ